jgi:hypothetical protein
VDEKFNDLLVDGQRKHITPWRRGRVDVCIMRDEGRANQKLEKL